MLVQRVRRAREELSVQEEWRGTETLCGQRGRSELGERSEPRERSELGERSEPQGLNELQGQSEALEQSESQGQNGLLERNELRGRRGQQEPAMEVQRVRQARSCVQ